MKNIKLFEEFLKESQGNTSLGTYYITNDGDMCSVKTDSDDAEHNFTDEDFVEWTKDDKDDEITALICDAISNQFDEIDSDDIQLFNKDYDIEHKTIMFDWSNEIDEKETGAYPAPKFARKPAAGDKGYNYVAKQFGADPAPKKKNKGSKTE